MAMMSCGHPVPLADRPPPPIGIKRVNPPIHPGQFGPLELCEQREQPYGEERWVQRIAKRLRLEHTVRREGGPRKKEAQAVTGLKQLFTSPFLSRRTGTRSTGGDHSVSGTI